jgi:flavin reductase (DIM6/NTAB) family NADH-FMN oxidoreductase RutF
MAARMNPHCAPVDLSKVTRLLNPGPTVLVSASHGGIDNVMAAAWCCALDFTPPKLTVVLDKSTYTRRLVEAEGIFGIQIPVAAQASLVHAAGSLSRTTVPDKLSQAGIHLMRFAGCDVPFVEGCAAWLACRRMPEPHNESVYDLFIAEITAAWADTRVFENGRWKFAEADPGLRTLHHVAGGHFHAIGEAVDA